MAERQLSAYGIDVQIDPWAVADFHMLIVSNLGAETADWNEIIHGTLPRALGSIPDECPTCQPSKGWNRANRLTRLPLSSDNSPVPQPKAILNDHQVDDLTTGDTAPPTNSVMLAAARPNEKIHRTHEAMATMTIHPAIAPVKTGTVLSYDMLSATHRSRVLCCVPDEASYTVAALSSD
jgi:hypothetical protein